ncbi:hypothetical protein [Natrarchaeobius chitinivorans]|uniref:Uncharacterized protein n=1 Tax=Natrarchaeobius chitinivorans TaxID=1679083 RepID=A0A3N6MAR3_NATCH|nr:hypothetical protein [Natrarchaeobius chitinivorans]RQG97754.1 hypothetical protein EA473_00625 [Natrarchaeobius chitinivorans]
MITVTGTMITVTGTTVAYKRATNTFVCDDQTGVVATVNGPSPGYRKSVGRNDRAVEYGVFGPAGLMPGFDGARSRSDIGTEP